jgi:RNA polymerase sigma factor (sigma-70 family)
MSGQFESMPSGAWWNIISTTELLDLRRRLLAHLRATFRALPDGETEDVVQHAFLDLFRRRDTVQSDQDGLYRYLLTVARHTAVDRIRKADQQERHLPKAFLEKKLDAPVPQGSSGAADEAEEAEKIWGLFCALDDLERFILWSHVVEGRSIRSIAQDLGLNWHRVAGIVEAALRVFRQALES